MLIATETDGERPKLLEDDLFAEPVGDFADQTSEVAAFLNESDALAQRMDDATDFAQRMSDNAQDAAMRRAHLAAQDPYVAAQIADFRDAADTIIDRIDSINDARRYLEQDIVSNAAVSFSNATASAVDVDIAELRMKLAVDMHSAMLALNHEIHDLLRPLPQSSSILGTLDDATKDYAWDLRLQSLTVKRAMGDATR
ncbi:MAG: hypothetical protein AAGH68_09755 [Pseudomonadota bacterium]